MREAKEFPSSSVLDRSVLICRLDDGRWIDFLRVFASDKIR